MLICFQQHGHKTGCTKPCSNWKSLRKPNLMKHMAPFPILVISADLALLNEMHCLTMVLSCPALGIKSSHTGLSPLRLTQTSFGPQRELS